MISILDRYLNDPQFHVLVDSMVSYLKELQYSPSELKEAVTLACIKFEAKEQYKESSEPDIPKDTFIAEDYFVRKLIEDHCKKFLREPEHPNDLDQPDI